MVLTDIDGTLMTDKGTIPSESNKVISALISRGVKFVVASGRQINNLYDLFSSHAEDLYYIAQNGAIIAQGRQILYEKPMKEKAVKKCITFARQSSVDAMLYTKDTVVVENGDPEFLSFLDKHQVEYFLSDNLDEHANRTYKLTIFKKDGNMSKLKKDISIAGVNVFLVNDYLIDINNEDTDKGKAVKRLKKLLGVRKHEILAFGDSENDLAMFAEVGKSFAVNNAPKEVLEKVSCVIPSNNEYGVVVTLKQLFNLT